jgi:hypothetical protein
MHKINNKGMMMLEKDKTPNYKIVEKKKFFKKIKKNRKKKKFLVLNIIEVQFKRNLNRDFCFFFLYKYKYIIFYFFFIIKT